MLHVGGAQRIGSFEADVEARLKDAGDLTQAELNAGVTMRLTT